MVEIRSKPSVYMPDQSSPMTGGADQSRTRTGPKHQSHGAATLPQTTKMVESRAEVLCDFKLYTDKPLQANQPDIVVC